MPNYRRAFVPGGCWFFTVNLQNRQSRLLTEQIEALRHATRKTRSRFPFEINAWVILPDHMHAVWTLPPDDADFSTRWRLIKSYFANTTPPEVRPDMTRRRTGESGISQKRYWEHLIRDEGDYARHIEYCYINPVKHGHARRVQDWPHSSFHRDVAAGIFPIDWAGEVDTDGEFGEHIPV